ncbi:MULTISPECIES: carnitine metabolism transcriptional regulator CaiF [unclassified Serratia (in: enterobacteria)]|uniref:carnitine metabolism transcriptional regulator CaiF n=1 Tax=unclassified Serratia (in: enterobacteria) TaxID=2647522 RepID=UPI0018AB83E7|nr:MULTISPECIES: carnitine metabolism transcriptional regulator CaiF [unclassified Serratia (in: enterobacteria)]
MNDKCIDKPLYLLIADWVMAQNRWISAKEIACEFNIAPCKAINTVSYILADVEEIECETKTMPTQLKGRGCQCQRLLKVSSIDKQLYARLESSSEVKNVFHISSPRLAAVPPGELNQEQKWQWMLSKTQRR